MEIGSCLVAGVEPLLLPITNNPVSVSGSGSSYGLGATIGTPNQFFSLKPAVNQNNTFVVNANYCGTSSNYSCIAENGGVYTPPANIMTTNNVASWNGTPGEDVETSAGYRNVFFNDKLQIGGKDIWGLPFFTYVDEDTGFSQPSGLAIGTNSSFLEAAIASEVIATKQWSIWPGNVYDGLDGLLILGGYDEDRAGSKFTTMPVKDNTALYVEITGLEWEHSATNHTNLMPNDTARMIGTLEPFFDYLTLPYESNSLLRDALNATYNTTLGYVYEYKPKGSLIVTLSNGLKTTIPADDLFDFPSNYSDKGVLSTTDYDWYQAKMYSSDTYPDGLLWFGQPFLTQKLLVADFDHGVYHLADAVKQDLGTGARSLKALCSGGPTPPPNCTSCSDNDDDDDDDKDGGEKKTNVAAIAGGVGGGVGGLLIVALVAFFCMRRRKQQRSAQLTAQEQAQRPNSYSHNQPEVVQAEPPYRGSTMMSPPPKYVQAGVYETHTGSPQYNPNDHGRASMLGSELASPDPMSPRSEGGYRHNQSGTFDNRYSQVGTHSVSDRTYEMGNETKLAATSGPVEMPSEYDHR